MGSDFVRTTTESISHKRFNINDLKTAPVGHFPLFVFEVSRSAPDICFPVLLQTRLASELLSSESVSFGVAFLHLKILSKKQWVVFQLTHGEGLWLKF